MPVLEAFADILKRNEPLAPYTRMKLGGPAEMLVQPRSRDELAAVIKVCSQSKIPLRVLGGGCHLLVSDEGTRGVVLRLSEPAFTQITVANQRVQAGAGTPLAGLISQAARHALAGLEPLVGIYGTVGGALRRNAGEHSDEVGRSVQRVEVMDNLGRVQVLERDELSFADGLSSLDDPVLLSADFALENDQPDDIVKRMRKAWIQRKAHQPLSFQPAARIFRNPRGLSAAAMIEQAGLIRTRVGGVEISDRDASFVLAHPGATARDVLRLIDLVRSKVRERFHVDLELDIVSW